MKILIVEDDIKIGNSLAKGIKAEGYEVTLIANGDLAIANIATNSHQFFS